MKQLLKKILFITRCTALLLVLAACDDFTEVERPSGQLTRDAVFEDAATAEAALLHIYVRMRDWGMLTGTSQSVTTKLGAYADEFAFYGPAVSSTANFYNNALLPADPVLASWWKEAYNQIYAANAILEGLSASGSIAKEAKDRIAGEALFIRGYLHFQLSLTFGNIPYVTTTDYQANSAIGRSDAAQVISRALEDLQAAVIRVPAEYTDPGRTRPNRFAIQAIMARMYLYQKDWAEASDMASQVINATALYTWVEAIDQVFKKDSPATIWQYYPPLPGRNTNEAASFILLTGPPADVALSASLLNAFEPGDLRKEYWVGSVSDGGQTWYYPYKYKERTSTSSSVEYSVQLRLAELYLIRAEARARQGELVGAKEDLDRIRNRAGLPPSDAVSKDALLEAIYRERRIELFAEAGHRFYDLKRSGRLDEVLGAAKPGWNPEDANLPLPETELLLNPNLAPQNPGY
ncbi:RagB/SusD family nutrient uptake outer membrane protein [Flavobacterium sp. NRK1]|uniref:RagB/SusD family nutrient uptake outer membrane protein n=1 Tax=Flavobacterium sp. NRK1 TaxID=2954929 RepID=UPI002091F5F7|nr:RagB/SusD family nutrient uptake outer membrane protein [Flavobacterium sp. NRK1]MCO6148960.1 RagB/SusD family nutrient uptake outer membrane protein [Flavobacterium sp. NRK1]